MLRCSSKGTFLYGDQLLHEHSLISAVVTSTTPTAATTAARDTEIHSWTETGQPSHKSGFRAWRTWDVIYTHCLGYMFIVYNAQGKLSLEN